MLRAVEDAAEDGERPSTIRGDLERRNGVLNSELCVGRLVRGTVGRRDRPRGLF